MICANNLKQEVTGFKTDTNLITMITKSEVIELRKQHDAVRRQLRKEPNARIKLALKEQEVKLAKELRQKQQKFFEMQDQCADQVDKLTERLRKSMESIVEHSLLFKFSWQII